MEACLWSFARQILCHKSHCKTQGLSLSLCVYMVSLANAALNGGQVFALLVIANELWVFAAYYWRQFIKRQYQSKVAREDAEPAGKRSSRRGRRKRRSPSPRTTASADEASNSYSDSEDSDGGWASSEEERGRGRYK